MFFLELINSLPPLPRGFQILGLISPEFGACVRRLSIDHNVSSPVVFGFAGVLLTFNALLAATPHVIATATTHGVTFSWLGDLLGAAWGQMFEIGRACWTTFTNLGTRPRPPAQSMWQIVRVFEYEYDPLFRLPHQVFAGTPRRWVLGDHFEMLPTPGSVEGLRTRYLDRMGGAFYGQYVGFEPLVQEYALHNPFQRYNHLYFIRQCDWFDPDIWRVIRAPVSQVLGEELPELCNEHYGVLERRQMQAELNESLEATRGVDKKRLM